MDSLKIVQAGLLPTASSVTDADMILIVQTGRLKRALPSAMKGDRGDNVYLGLSDTHIQWKIGVNGAWQNLIAVDSLRGRQGYKPVFRKVGGTLQVKYENESDSAYVNIFDREELKMAFSDLTADEVERLKLHFSDLTAEDIATLQKPATEAANEIREAAMGWQEAEDTRKANEVERSAAEAARKSAEISRSEAESTRQANEASRKVAESTRQSNEETRIAAESARQQAETLRGEEETFRKENEAERQSNEEYRISAENERNESEQTRISAENTREENERERMVAESERIAAENQRWAAEEARDEAESEREAKEENRQLNTAIAISNANEAANSALEAKQAAEEAAQAALSAAKNLPKIVGGTWRIYNPYTKEYEDSGVDATGKSPIIQGGTWWLWDYATQGYVDSGQSVDSDYKAYVPRKYPRDIDLTTLSTYEEDGEVKDFVSGNLIYVENELEPTGYSVFIYTPHGAGYAWVKIVLITDGMHLILVSR